MFLDDIRFVWDTDKNESNIKRHGISFEEAALVFRDDARIEIVDKWHTDEERYNVIGMVGDVIFVVYTERKDYIRLISARPATGEERRLYYDGYV